jgi:glycosyltransferase involved in cell wall biosynthesis
VSERLRILHVLLSRGFAGTERATAEMCNVHAAAHDVCLVLRKDARGSSGASIVDHLDDAVQLREIGRWWPRRALAREIHEFAPHVIHAHLRRGTRLVARIAPPCPTIATLHMWVNGRHFLDMDGLIVIARWQRRDLANYEGRIFEIRESLVPHRRLSAGEVAATRAALGAAPGEFLIGAVGRLAHSKGFDLLIRAFAQARPDRSRLVIVGAGRERPALEKLARGLPVQFAGFRDDVKDCYQAFDLFVSSSRSEPLGRVLFEALDAGVPVLATRTQGPSEILAQYPGELVDCDDVGALAAALQRLVATPPARVRPDLAPYHLDVVAAETLAAYRELIQDSAGGRSTRR